jgi:hypothetical protein
MLISGPLRTSGIIAAACASSGSPGQSGRALAMPRPPALAHAQGMLQIGLDELVNLAIQNGRRV